MTTAFISDLHISPLVWARRPEIKNDAYAALELIHDAVNIFNKEARSKNQVTLPDGTVIDRPEPISQLYLLGDIFDTHTPSPKDVLFFKMFIDRMHDMINATRVLTQSGPFFGAIEGQHDRSTFRLLSDSTSSDDHYTPFSSVPLKSVRWTSLMSRVHSINKDECWLDSKTCAYALDHTPKDKLAEALAKIPERCSVLLAHQCWEEFMPSGASSDGSLSLIPKHVKTVITGDNHVPFLAQFERVQKSSSLIRTHRATPLRKPLKLDNDTNTLTVFSLGATHARAINENVYPGILCFQDGLFFRIPFPSRSIFLFGKWNRDLIPQAVTQISGHKDRSDLPLAFPPGINQWAFLPMYRDPWVFSKPALEAINKPILSIAPPEVSNIAALTKMPVHLFRQLSDEENTPTVPDAVPVAEPVTTTPDNVATAYPERLDPMAIVHDALDTMAYGRVASLARALVARPTEARLILQDCIDALDSKGTKTDSETTR